MGASTVVVQQGVQSPHESEEALLTEVEQLYTKPLWKQMTRLNPPLPNPTAIPHVWRYDQIRPNLLRAGELVCESQAERRVLMLVNPSRGMALLYGRDASLTVVRCPIYHRHHLRRAAARHAQRNGQSS